MTFRFPRSVKVQVTSETKYWFTKCRQSTCIVHTYTFTKGICLADVLLNLKISMNMNILNTTHQLIYTHFRYSDISILVILTHNAGILLSHPGVGFLYPTPTPVALAPMLSHTPNYFIMTTTTTTTTPLNKLPLSNIILGQQTIQTCFYCIHRDGIK